jgi:N-acyl-D-amino-acid deacylase
MVLRTFICCILAIITAVSPAALQANAASDNQTSSKAEYPVTGNAVEGLENFEIQLTGLLQARAVPGATVAIAKNGRLVYARGFGWSNIEDKIAMQPDVLFRIASISKAITAVATMRLVQEGKLGLDQHAFEILNELKPCVIEPKGIDPRIFQITVRNLLHMTAGWNRTHTGDPMFKPIVDYASFHCSPTLRADSVAIIRYWMGKQLDFDPGSSYAYSNLCYAVLEQIIKKASGQRYSEYVRKNILLPCGITDMRLGHTRELAERETRYYPFPGQEYSNSYFPNVKGLVPLQYGGDFSLEALSGAAGWIGSSVDLVRLISTIGGDRNGKSPISAASFKTMLTCPDVPYWKHRTEYFGMGFEVLPIEDSKGTGYVFWRIGSFPGSMAFVVHSDDGMAWAFEVNSRPQSQMEFLNEIRTLINDTVKSQKSWPDVDLFERYK